MHQATSDGVDFDNDGNTTFIAVCNEAATHTMTIKKQNATGDGADFADEVVTVPVAGEICVIQRIATAPFNVLATGKCQIDFEGGEEEHLKVCAVKNFRATG